MSDYHGRRLQDSFFPALAPPPSELIWQWAEKNVYLSGKVSPAAPGLYDTRNTPAIRGILETAQKGEKRHITIQKAAQAGMTLACYIVVLHKICNDQVPCGITMPSVDQARKKAEKVFIPMIEDSPVIAAQKPDNPDDFKKLEQQMRGMTVTWLGTNNASQLASDTFGMLLIDEPDKYPHVLAGESTPLMLLMERTTTLWNHLVLLPCTPTTERGVVHKEWQKGDRREYYVPCIHCNEMQVIRWQAFKFDSKLPIEDAAQGAYIECIHCKGKISGHEKNEMLEDGEWRATCAPETYDRASFHFPRWLSTWESGSPYSIVRQFLQVKDKPNELRGWIQNTLAEPFIEEKIDVGDEELKSRRANYDWGQRPSATDWGRDMFNIKGDTAGDDVRTIISIDVQKTHFWVLAREWQRGGASALIEFSTMATWQELADYVQEMTIWPAIIDAAYGERTQEVYQMSSELQFVPCMGRGASRIGQLWNQQSINPWEGTKRQQYGRSVQLIQYDSDAFRRQLMDRMNGYTLDEEKNAVKCPFPWFIPHNAPIGRQSYTDQVTAMHYDPEKEAWVCKKGRRDEHAFDCEVMSILGAEMMGFNTRLMQ